MISLWFEEYKDDLKEWVQSALREEGFTESDFELVDIAFYGSRTTGKESITSDLDVLVEYKGDAREDVVFDALCEKRMTLEDVALDFNPIKEDKSGTIKEYLSRCDDNWKEHISRRARGR